MIRYTGVYVTFQEVPNEVSLTLAISGCPFRCQGCHSPYLQEEMGEELTSSVLFRLLAEYRDGITCVCFMGGDGDLRALESLFWFVHACGFKVCFYSGGTCIEDFDNLPDYYKTGPYIASRGGLASRDTNQRMYRLIKEKGVYEDITHLFWKEKT